MKLRFDWRQTCKNSILVVALIFVRLKKSHYEMRTRQSNKKKDELVHLLVDAAETSWNKRRNRTCCACVFRRCDSLQCEPHSNQSMFRWSCRGRSLKERWIAIRIGRKRINHYDLSFVRTSSKSFQNMSTNIHTHTHKGEKWDADGTLLHDHAAATLR